MGGAKMGFREPWFWWPLIGPAFLAVTFGWAAYYYNRNKTYPRKVRAAGFNGIVRETAKYAVVGSGAGFVTGIIAKDLDGFAFFRQAMFAILLISLVAAILNYWMSAALDTRKGDDEKSIELTSVLWTVIHGVIFGLSLGAMCAILVAIIAFASSYSG